MELALTKFLLIMLGGSLGSFASVLIYRLPRSHESITILKSTLKFKEIILGTN